MSVARAALAGAILTLGACCFADSIGVDARRATGTAPPAIAAPTTEPSNFRVELPDSAAEPVTSDLAHDQFNPAGTTGTLPGADRAVTASAAKNASTRPVTSSTQPARP